MKNVLCFWLVFLVVLFTGCQKDPEPTEPPLATIPSIFMTPSVDVTVNHGDTLTFIWEMKGNSDNFSTRVSLGGEVISQNVKGSVTTSMTFSTTFIVHIFMNDGRESIRTVNITVRPSVVIDPPKIFLIYNPDTIQYDSSFFIEWTTENTTSLWMNNIVVPVYGHYMFTQIKADTIISFRAVGPGGATNDSVHINVAEFIPPPPLPTNLLLITAHPWEWSEWWQKDFEDDPWIYWEVPQSWKEEKNIFFQDYWSEIWKDGLLVGNGPFQIDSVHFNWGNIRGHIVVLDDTLFTFITKVRVLNKAPLYPLLHINNLPIHREVDSVIVKITFIPYKE